MTKTSHLIPNGWIGGFAQSNPAFAYPNPDLTSLSLTRNMANISRLTRQQKVLWPEFSWQTAPDGTYPGPEKTRCYQMFAPDISRIGYNDQGQVFSIICPQQGAFLHALGSLNVEVTVTGVRGWVDEPKGALAADLTVTGQIWFSAQKETLAHWLWEEFTKVDKRFPYNKANAIQVATSAANTTGQAWFSARDGESSDFPIPDFARHADEAYTVGNLAVEIGDTDVTGDAMVDDFNSMIMDLFNIYSGNMLSPGNILTWNVWFAAPELVNQHEWAQHAAQWRDSIDADHRSPDGPGHPARFFDGSPFEPIEDALKRELARLTAFIDKHIL